MSLPTARPEHRRLARAAGALVLAGGLLALSAELVLHRSPALEVAAVLVTAASVGLMARLRLAGRGRTAQAALTMWAASLVVELTVVVAVPEGRADGGGPAAAGTPWLVGPVGTLLLVTGPLVAGTAIGRAGVLIGWRRWVPLAFGLVQAAEFLPPGLGLTVSAHSVVDDVTDAISPAITLVLAVALLTAFRRSVWLDRWRRSAAVLAPR